MINLAEIKQEASKNNIREDIIEKDYCLGWVIWGISSNEELKNNLAFKGGTALKKCFFDTYRFSEDLDFTVLSDVVYSKEKFQICVQDVARRVSQASNIQFPQVSVEESQDLRGNATFQIKISYIGPRRQIGSPAKIKLDLTKFEAIVLPLETRPLFHNYSDNSDIKHNVLCYSLDEILAEKMRSLLERTRARDFYDAWRLLRDHNADINLNRFKESFNKKCDYKSISLRTIDDFLSPEKEEELRSDWRISLPHQLNYLPDFEIVKDEFYP